MLLDTIETQVQNKVHKTSFYRVLFNTFVNITCNMISIFADFVPGLQQIKKRISGPAEAIFNWSVFSKRIFAAANGRAPQAGEVSKRRMREGNF